MSACCAFHEVYIRIRQAISDNRPHDMLGYFVGVLVPLFSK